MPLWVKKLIYALLGVTAVVFVGFWLVLAAPFFSDFRRTIVQDALSEQIGQPLLIETDVRAVIGVGTRLSAHDVVIPSEGIDALNLAELDLLELDLDLLGFLVGDLNIDNIKVEGLRVLLKKQEDGTTSWSDRPTEGSAKPVDHSVENGIIAFLSDKNVALSSINMTYQNEKSGFDFLFDLEALTIEQVNFGETVILASQGTINQLPFEIDGNFPSGAMSSTIISAGEIDVRVNGKAIPVDQGGGFSGVVSLNVDENADVLRVLQLEGESGGSATLTAEFVRQGQTLKVNDLQTIIDFANGSEFTLEGSAQDLLSTVDFEVSIASRLFPEGQPPTRAKRLEDLEFTGFSADLISQAGTLAVNDVHVETNFIETVLEKIGPITVDRVRRNDDETLGLQGIDVQLGPAGSPYVSAQGSIQDLLHFEQVAFDGTLTAPASLVLPEFETEEAAAFGNISGEFEFSDKTGELSLTKFLVRSENTELWSLEASADNDTFRRVDGVDLQLNLDIPDGAAFLSALQLKAVNTGPFAYATTVKGGENGLQTILAIQSGQSRLTTDVLTHVDKTGRPTVRGSVQSDRLDVGDLSNAVDAIIQLSSLKKRSEAEAPEREVQPLVLDSEDETSGQYTRADGRTVQPLVLAEGNGLSQNETSDRMVQPRVLDDTEGAETAIDLLDLEQIGRNLDLEIDVEIAEVKGQGGVARISSDLISKNGRADLGPLELELGEGRFSVGAAVDFVDAPQLARIYGATRGWDFGKLLDQLAGIQARGELRGAFDLTGNNRSAESFVNSMSGSVDVSMVNGAIATSLLELAGLGVLPWLFSRELQQGYTDIVCVEAPLRINRGTASSDAVVLETRRVQVVARGSADWKNDQIAIRAEPRPVGRPLSRTAWPFEVTGRLSNPEVNLTSGTRQSRPVVQTGRTSGPRTPCKPDITQ